MSVVAQTVAQLRSKGSPRPRRLYGLGRSYSGRGKRRYLIPGNLPGMSILSHSGNELAVRMENTHCPEVYLCGSVRCEGNRGQTTVSDELIE
ncbi:MAG: hypothetical protein L0H75_06665, partial [Nitrosospira sp.]|nr:hypothetical protein [Nitrosospira sp.]